MDDQRALLLNLLRRVTATAQAPEGIAVIGLAGRYPLADSPDQFWRNLLAGRDCIREVPAQRWDADAHYDPAGRGRSYSKWAGFLDGVDLFDPLFFQIAPEQAEAMDPQERLFLQTAWATFEDAGYPPAALARTSRVGVFAGVMNNDYEWMAGRADALGVQTQARSSHWSVANRVSFTLDLRGPSVAVDTACSASLTAVHLACQSLRAGECDVALAGGVNLILDPSHLRGLSERGMISRGSVCRSFGAGADGFVDGEGVGAVLLKPLRRAVADGDRIDAVILGSAINSGGRTSGYTVPSATAQTEVITAALRQARVDPATLSYLETHGTGTALGDPLEIRALTEALGGPVGPDRGARRCAIGSAKSAIGHLESAAGIAGLTKVLMQLRHDMIAPSLHADEPNPHIDFDQAPVELVREARPWPKPADGSRRAGISSFGGGGANAHIVIEEYRPAADGSPAESASGPELVVLSARTATQLVEVARRLADHLTGRDAAPQPVADPAAAERLALCRAEAAAVLGVDPHDVDVDVDLASCGFDLADLVTLADRLRPSAGPAAAEAVLAGCPLTEVAAHVGPDQAVPTPAGTVLADVAHTLQTGRTAMAHRLAFVAEDVADAARRLTRWADGDQDPDIHTGHLEHSVGEPSAAQQERRRRVHAEADLAAAGALWVEGVDLDWSQLRAGRPARRIPLPTYPFGGQRYWIAEPPSAPALATSPGSTAQSGSAAAASSGSAAPSSRAASYGSGAPFVAGGGADLRYYRPVWQPAEAILTTRPVADPQQVLILAPDGARDLADAIAAHHPHDRVRIVPVDGPLDPTVDRVYHLGGVRLRADERARRDPFACGLSSLLRLIRQRAEESTGGTLQVRVVTADVVDLDSGGSGDPFAAALHGIMQVAPKEVPGLQGVCVDVASAELPDPAGVRRVAAAIVAESCDTTGRAVVLRRKHRYLRQLAEVELAPPEPVFRDRGSYLIVGGTGGIGQALSLRLARRHQARLVWLSRGPLSPDARDTVAQIVAAGGEVVHVQGDIASGDTADRVVRVALDRFGDLHGVVHAAMAFDDRMLAQTDDDAVRALVAVKTEGVNRLVEAVAGRSLDFLTLFSSVGSFGGTAGNGAYIAGCAVEDALGRHLRQDGRLPVSVVNWGYWGPVGSGARPGLEGVFAALGIEPIGLEEGLDAIDRVLGNAVPQVLVLRAHPSAEATLGVTPAGRGSVTAARPARLGTADPGRSSHRATPAAGDVLTAHEQLGQLTVPLLLDAYRRLGAFHRAGERYQLEDLRRSLGISDRFVRLHAALAGILADAGLLTRDGAAIATLPGVEAIGAADVAAAEAGCDELIRQFPEVEPTVTLTRLFLRSYPEILRGEVNATEIMFPGSSMRLVQNFYRGNALTDSFNQVLRDALAGLVDAWAAVEDSADRPFQVVELGAGTGATTEVLLPVLAPHAARVRYHVTDVSSRFLEHGAERFAATYPFARFKVLDLEREPAQQGFVVGSADVVVATNVVHATRDLRETLRRAKTLLRPGGWLLLNELIAVREIVTLCGGVLEGWWRFDDPSLRIVDSPLVERDTWRQLLWEAGFEQVRAVRGHWDGRDLGQSVVVGRSDGVLVAQGTPRPVAQSVPAPAEPVAVLPAAIRPPEPERVDLVAEIRDVVAATLRLDETLDADRPLADYGFDSLNGIKVAAAIEERLGVPVRLSTLFENPTVHLLAEHFADAVTPAPADPAPVAHAVSTPAVPATRPATVLPIPLDLMVEPTRRHPLAQGQRALWILEQLAPGNYAYNLPLALWLAAGTDVPVLRAALRVVVAAHAALRSRIVETDDGPVVEVVGSCDVPLRHTLLDGGEDVLRERMRAEVRRPFDLAAAPLLRADVFTLDDGRSALLVTFHHIVFDGLSIPLFLRDVERAYADVVAGRRPHVPAPPKRYQDFVDWQQELLTGPQAERLRGFWLDRLADVPAPTQLPLDRPRPSVPSFHGDSHEDRIDADVADAVRALAAAENTSRFTVYLAAYVAVVSRYSQQPHVVVGVPAAGRPPTGFNDVIGYFMNMIPLAHQVRAQDGFRALVRQLHRTVVDGVEHSAYPYLSLVQERARREPGQAGEVFRLAFYFQNWVSTDSAGRQLLDAVAGVHQEGEFDLTLEVVEEASGARCCVKYAPELFDPDTIERFMGHYRTLLRAALAEPERPVGGLDLLTGAELRRALAGNPQDYPREHTTWDLVRARSTDTPDAVAVVDAHGSLTYAELAARVATASAGLLARGIGTGDTVGVLLPRTADLPVALLAILRCGAAYVPLDPMYPPERLTYMARDAGLNLLLVGADEHADADAVAALRAAGVPVARWGTDDLTAAGTPQEPTVGPDDLAYVIYTSGSTGRPKGVEIPHRALTNLLTSMAREPGCGPGERLLALTTICFDIAGLELFLPLISGGTVEIVPDEIARDGVRLCRELTPGRATIVQATPATWRMLLAAGWEGDPQLRILCGGEALDPDTAAALLARAGEVWNVYGPTETTIWSSARRLEPGQRVTIGTAIANTRLLVLDESRQLVPPGVPGELYIGGDGLARGYRGLPELTAQRFVPDPFGPGLLYRTGDLVRARPEGDLEYLTRLDAQVKVRGFRIELEEIEEALRRQPGVRAAVVVAQPRGVDGHLLLGCVTLDPGASAPAAEDLRSWLPEYMVPHAIVAVRAFPLTLNGKVDRKALTGLTVAEVRTTWGVDAAAPAPATHRDQHADPLVAGLAAQVANLTGLDPARIGVRTPLGELGLSSVGFTALGADLSRRLGVEVRPTVFYQHGTVTTLARYLTQQHRTAVEAAYGVARLPEPAVGAHAQPGLTALPAPTGADRDVAVIGAAARLPGSADLDTFWAHLLAGDDLVTEIPTDRWDWRSFDGREGRPASRSRWGGFAPDVDRFDAAFFGISPREAELMDPQQRLVLEAVWSAVEHAGYRPSDLAGRRVGVFLAVTNTDYPEVQRAAGRTPEPHTLTGAALSIVPNRVSYLLDLRGPSVAVDTACSGSLTAVHEAVAALHLGDCDLAIAGGVSLILSPSVYLALSQSEMLSPEGRCKAFDSAADGYVRGEGVGVVVLKPNAAAQADGDAVLGVIKGTAINHSGRTTSLTAPNPDAQAAVVLAAHHAAGTDPATVGYIETHGTGTALGDPIEVTGLRSAFETLFAQSGRPAPAGAIGIGSVKTNIGHLEAAAGVAGLLKALLALRHHTIPATLHFHEANPYLPLDDGPLRVVERATDWPAPLGPDGAARPRRAGVSSFGFGGANAHVVVEEAPPATPAPATTDRNRLYVLSARTPEALRATAERLASHLPAHPELDPGDVAFTLYVGREAWEHRLAVLADGLATCADALRRHLATPGGAAASGVVVAGGGTEHRDIAERWVRGEDVDLSAAVGSGRRVHLPAYPFARTRHWVRSVSGGRPAAQVTNTMALLDSNVSTLDGVAFDKELTGQEPFLRDHVVAGSPVLPGAVQIAMARRAGLLADPQRPVLCVEDIVWGAPVRLAGAGTATRIRVAVRRDAAGQLTFELRDVLTGVPHATGTLSSTPPPQLPRVDLDAVTARCPDRVDEAACYAQFEAVGFDYGPTFRLVREIAQGDSEAIARLTRPGGVEQDGDADADVLMAAAVDTALQVAGRLVSGGRTDQPAHLPFSVDRVWLTGPLPQSWSAHAVRRPGGAGSLVCDISLAGPDGAVFGRVEGFALRPQTAPPRDGRVLAFAPLWTPAPSTPGDGALSEPQGGTTVLVGFPAGSALADRLAAGTTTLTCAGLDGTEAARGALTATLAEAAGGPAPHRVVQWGAGTADGSGPGLRTAITIAAQWHARTQPLRWLYLAPGNAADPADAAMTGFARSLAAENPRLRLSVLAVPDAAADAVADAVARELNGRGVAEVRIDQAGQRYQPAWRRTGLPVEPTPLARPGVHLVVGGTGALGLGVAARIARHPGATVVLLSRTDPGPDAAARIGELTAGGAHVDHVRADVADRASLRAALTDVRHRFGPITGVVHAAGVLRPGLLAGRSAADIDAVLEAKVTGLRLLDEQTVGDDLAYLVVFSSIASVLPGLGQVDYAYAAAYLDHFAVGREQQRIAGLRRGRTLCVDWPLWADGGMQADPAVREWAATELGLHPLPSGPAFDALDAALATDAARLVLAVGDSERILRALNGAAPAEQIPAPDRVAPPPDGADDTDTDRVAEYLIGVVAAELGLPAAELPPTEPLERYGLDSLMIVALTRSLESRLGSLPKTLFFEHQTVEDLARVLVARHGGTRLVAPATTQTTAAISAELPGRDAVVTTTPAATPPQPDDDDDIVIIGIAGRYPQADDLREFWRNLRAGRDCIEEIPAERWRADAFFDPQKGRLGRSYSRWGGFLRDADRFDPLFFRMSQVEAEHVDPQERVFLQTVWQLLENAGYPREQLRGSRTGVFVGMMYGHYQLYGVQAALRGEGIATSSSYASVANRVSYFFDFHGPSVGLDTMCSSSLVTIHQACLAIRNGDCDTAVAGGVNISSHPVKYLQLAQRGFLSTDGRCRSFGPGGDGYVPAEGTGAVLLKRRSAAEADGDRILAVVKSSTVNHGGSGNGYSVPNPKAQGELIAQALRRAGVDPADLDYLEAHGTGTSLGDAVEMAGLAQAIGGRRPADRPLPIGSVKSNIGHAESAAGAAAVAKVLLQFQHRELVPSLHSTELNPALDVAAAGVSVQRELAPWPTPVGPDGKPRPRTAGISSFGAGGTNAHLVVQEYVAAPRPPARRHPGAGTLAVLSAPSAQQLRGYARRLAEHLDGEGADVDLDALCFTLQVGREAMAHRLAVEADDTAAVARALHHFAAGTPQERTWTGHCDPRRPGPALDPDTETTTGTAGLADAWTKGARVDWRARYVVAPVRVDLPGLLLGGERVWLATADAELAAVGAGPSFARRTLLVKDWAPAPTELGDLPRRIAVLATPATRTTAEVLAARLPGAELVDVGSPADRGTGPAFDAVVDLAGCAGGAREPLDGWLPWLQATVADRSRPLTLLLVTRGLEAPDGVTSSLAGAERVGLYRMLGAEYRHVRSRHLDVAATATDPAVADAVRVELGDRGDAVEVRVRGAARDRAVLRPTSDETGPSLFADFPADHVLWVTGGTRGIGLLTARHLVETHGVRRVVLSGRTPLPPRTQWPARSADQGAQGRLVRAVADLESRGARVEVLAVPLDQPERVAEAVRHVRATLGPIGALVHSAGTTDFEHPAFIHKPLDPIRAVLAPKVDGIDALVENLREEPLRFALLFSSVAAVSPALASGQSDYAMANAYLDYLAQARPFGLPIVSIQWPSWKDTGMGEATTATYRGTGLATLRDRDGLDLLDRAVAAGHRVVLPAVVTDPTWTADRITQPTPTPAAAASPAPVAGPVATAAAQSAAADPGPVRSDPVVKPVEGVDTAGAVAALTSAMLGDLAAELGFSREQLDGATPVSDYGTDSILVAQVIQGVGRRLGVELDPSALFENPTVDGFAAWIAQRHPTELVRAYGTDDAVGADPLAAPDGLVASNASAAPVVSDASSATIESDASSPTVESDASAAMGSAPSDVRSSPIGENQAPTIRDRGGDGPRPDDLAIVGMACRFPGAPDLDAYWRLLVEGRSAITAVPEDRWGRSTPFHAGLIDDWRSYDPEAFLLSARDAAAMDPQALMLLELVLTAAHHAGHPPQELKGRRIAVYVGGRSQHQPSAEDLAGVPNPVMVTGQNYLAANVSQFFDLHGPCLVVDTACSSSLVALEMAGQAIRSGDAEAAFVAGVSLLADDRAHRVFDQRGLLSAEPRFHAFDARGGGLVLGEGGGVVLVKSYARAVADGDRVYAVVRGLAVNNDGRTAGPATPNLHLQQEVMRRALQRSGLAPHQVAHVEANASGSIITDLLELKAVQAVYRQEAAGSPCTIGSVKPNIGHPLTAEGIAGLIKLVLMLHHRTRVPFLSGQQPMPHLDTAAAGLRIDRSAVPWDAAPLVAALNCFADGGTNVHVVLTPPPDTAPAGRDPLPLPELHRRDLRPAAPAAAPPGPVVRFFPGQTPRTDTASAQTPPAGPVPVDSPPVEAAANGTTTFWGRYR
ncbi:amino acid adenylation domain-containing protein [Dactylosporangium sp. NPDC051484]|uniref:amino acid adenylation domain-containing protein n=1 Tax=Dactylosporangium sp. NPDC051484 TaxID=3154942 RepID=UPI0034508487